jgi:hypothetical protein
MAMQFLFSDPRFRSPSAAVVEPDECVVCKKSVDRHSPDKHTYVELSVQFYGERPKPPPSIYLSPTIPIPAREVTRLRGVCCPGCAPVIADMLLQHGLVK